MNRNFRQLTVAALLAVPLAVCEQFVETAAICANFNSTLSVNRTAGSTTFEMRITNNQW